MSVKVKVEGLREIEQAMFEIKTVSAKAIARAVLKKAAQPMADHAARIAADDPVTSGKDLHRSIAVSARQRSGRGRAHRDGPGEVTVFMGVRTDIHDERDPKRTPYAVAMVNEFGSTKMRPRPFMRPAWTAGKETALNVIRAEMEKRVAAAVKRARKRALKAR